jgi:hypothetical protein
LKSHNPRVHSSIEPGADDEMVDKYENLGEVSVALHATNRLIDDRTKVAGALAAFVIGALAWGAVQLWDLNGTTARIDERTAAMDKRMTEMDGRLAKIEALLQDMKVAGQKASLDIPTVNDPGTGVFKDWVGTKVDDPAKIKAVLDAIDKSPDSTTATDAWIYVPNK